MVSSQQCIVQGDAKHVAGDCGVHFPEDACFLLNRCFSVFPADRGADLSTQL